MIDNWTLLLIWADRGMGWNSSIWCHQCKMAARIGLILVQWKEVESCQPSLLMALFRPHAENMCSERSDHRGDSSEYRSDNSGCLWDVARSDHIVVCATLGNILTDALCPGSHRTTKPKCEPTYPNLSISDWIIQDTCGTRSERSLYVNGCVSFPNYPTPTLWVSWVI